MALENLPKCTCFSLSIFIIAFWVGFAYIQPKCYIENQKCAKIMCFLRISISRSNFKKKPTDLFIYMIQVGSQKYKRMFSKLYFHVQLVEVEQIFQWIIAILAIPQNWPPKKKRKKHWTSSPSSSSCCCCSSSSLSDSVTTFKQGSRSSAAAAAAAPVAFVSHTQRQTFESFFKSQSLLQSTVTLGPPCLCACLKGRKLLQFLQRAHFKLLQQPHLLFVSSSRAFPWTHFAAFFLSFLLSCLLACMHACMLFSEVLYKDCPRFCIETTFASRQTEEYVLGD